MFATSPSLTNRASSVSSHRRISSRRNVNSSPVLTAHAARRSTRGRRGTEALSMMSQRHVLVEQVGNAKPTKRRERRRVIETRAESNSGEAASMFSFPLDGPSAPKKKFNLVANSVRLKSVLKLSCFLVVAGWSMRFAHDPSSLSMIPPLLKRTSGSACLGLLLALIGYGKKSLDLSGAVSASLVGVATIFSGVRFGLTLAFFFFSGSAVTKVQSEVKRRVDEHFKEGGGMRDFVQVMANGLVPTVLAAASLYSLGGLSFIANTTGGGAFAEAIISSGGSSSITSSAATSKLASTLAVAFLSYFSCCGGDTFASELGVLSKSKPRLITTFCRKEVEPGTNGGVSLLGVFASILGGLVAASGWAIGAYITSGAFTIEMLYALVIGAFGGFFGSFVDSILGATVQYSGYCSERKKVVSKPGPTVTKISGLELLSNSGVNVVSASLIAFAFGALYYIL